MEDKNVEFPVRGDFPPVPEDYPQPRPETEYPQPPDGAEDASPPGEDYVNPPARAEFSPPGSGSEDGANPPSGRKRRIRRLLYSAAALVMLGLLFGMKNDEIIPASAVTATAAPIYTSGSDIPLPTAAPTPEPTPVSKIPEITADFFFFSHEHHARIRMANTGALHSVEVRVRDKVLDLPVYSYDLSEREIASGLFELPILSTGDLYMENRKAYEAVNGWPEYEMTVDARYENEAGDGEEQLTLTLDAISELGIGLSYMRPNYTWSEVIPPDSFYVQPWEEIDSLRYVINDPSAVTDPLTVSVDISYNGRHAAPEEFEEVLEKSEYYLVNSETGERTPHVGYTRELVLRRPDWIPEKGTIHVCIVQYLSATGERWVREYDYDYPQQY